MSDTAQPDASTRLDEFALGLPRPAVRALIDAGLTTLGAARAAEDRDLLAHHGVGPKAVRTIRQLQGDIRPSVMDDYLDRLPSDQRAALARVRAVVRRAAPEAEEGTSYGMPAFGYAGSPLLGFRVSKRHLSLFPFSPSAIDAVKDRLDGFDLAKGTIRFSPTKPVPDDVLADLVRLASRDEQRPPCAVG
jgi:uncharacterized protein YdhG (YjbR/CyaY superfamily)